MAIIDKIDNLVAWITVFFKKYYYLPVVVLIIYLASSILIRYETAYYMEFNGIVQDVSYDFHGVPTIKIDGKVHTISYTSYSWPVKIEIGDKMIKRRKDIRLLLIKPNSKDTIDFTKPLPYKP